MNSTQSRARRCAAGRRASPSRGMRSGSSSARSGPASAVLSAVAVLAALILTSCGDGAEQPLRDGLQPTAAATPKPSALDSPGLDIARQFIAFARDPANNRAPSHVDPLPMYFEDEKLGAVSGDEEWEVCGIVGMGCDGPVRVRYAKAEPLILPPSERPSCFQVNPIERYDADHSVTVVPSADELDGQCGTAWAVVLYLNDSWDQIMAARLVTAADDRWQLEPGQGKGSNNGMLDSLDFAARQFLALATGKGDSLPVDTPVTLFLGGKKVGSIESEAVTQRRAWKMCPPSGQYAGAMCPFSALDVLRNAAQRGQHIARTTKPQAPPCVHWSVARETGGTHHVSLTVGDTCADWAAVTLYLNDVAQLVAVDLTMSEP